MNITVIGTGYVGLVTGTIFSELGNNVVCIDVNKKKIENLKKNISPIYEPGLDELIAKNQKAKRLTFSTNLKSAVPQSRVIFIAVGTPSDIDGRADLQYVEQVAKEIGKNLKSMKKKSGFKVIINKSTVPVGTGDMVKNIIKTYYSGEYYVVSNPEFLREGSAIEDCLHPDRVVIGDGHSKARKVMEELYKPLNCPVLFTDVKSAEMIKYASNAMLATQISFINSIAQICESVGADVEKVSQGMRYDKRIGKNAFLNAGCGYGGSCFPKDVKALIRIAHDNNFHFSILETVEDVNEEQKLSMVKKLKKNISGTLKGKTIGIWGLAFKPKTNDLREAVSIQVIEELLQEGAKIKAFDPVAQKEAEKIFINTHIIYSKTPFLAAKNADALLILTEWDEFRQIDLDKLKNTLKAPFVVDGRNIFDPNVMKKKKFRYISIGR